MKHWKSSIRWCIPNCYVLTQKVDSEEGGQETKLIHLKYDARGERLPGPVNKWVVEQINPETSLKVTIAKVKLFYLGHIMRR